MAASTRGRTEAKSLASPRKRRGGRARKLRAIHLSHPSPVPIPSTYDP